MTDFERYFTDILDGKIIACEKMKKVSELLLNNYHFPKKYHFDPTIAKKHTEFIEKFCKTPTGKIGTPLELDLFQKARLEAIFGFVDDNDLRQYNEVLIIEGRKNGKTTECAAVEIDLVMNDDEGAPEVYNIATKYEQAMKGFNAANNMRRQSALIAKHLRKRSSDLYCHFNMGFIKAMASNAKSLDSLDAHGVIIDELAAITNRDIYDLMKQSMGARSQPLLFCITTNGFVRGGIFDSQYEYAEKLLNGEFTDEHFLPFIYELDSPEEWDKEEMWIKANPGIGTIKSISYQRQMVRKAKRDPSFKPTVMVKDFNIPENKASNWLSWETLNNEELIPDYPFKYAIGGMDAADCVDLNAAKAICKRPNDDKLYIKSMYWLPESVIEEYENSGKRQGRDNVPYSLWRSQGYLRTVPGKRVDKKVFLDWFCELRDEQDLYIQYIGYDPWHIDDSLLRAFESEFGKNAMIPVRQGIFTQSQPMKELEAMLREKLIVYNNNPIDKWCLINSTTKTDINGNIQLIKGTDQRQRIDGTAALIDAFKIYLDKKDEFESVI